MNGLESREVKRVQAIVATRIRELREGRGLSQEELADLAGCHRTYISMLERGRGNPSLSLLVEISEALGVRVTDLFGK